MPALDLHRTRRPGHRRIRRAQTGAHSEHPGEPLRGEKSGYDFRPQIVGVFTDLSGPAPPGLSFSATVDTRYSSHPTPLKMAAMILGVVLTVAALIALHVLDTADGTRHRRFLPPRWWSVGGLDALVTAVLVWWHFVGANTADDGYILTMARVSEHAGYMANYYRWLGTPEAPFGWYYDLLAMWAHVSTTSVWMRLPTLVIALTCWWVISREVIPRLGHAVKNNRAAAWTAAGMFLAVWLPLDNGLRPEPIIALGILLTWCSVERAVATNRLLPVAIACIIGALTLFSGPTGIASIGAVLVAIGPLRTIMHRRSKQFGALPLLAPILAAATVTVILIFRDQTLAGEVQATALKRALGPSLSWFDEHIRYERLFMASPDGSVARRFAVLALLLALAVSVAMSLRKGRIPGTAAGPSRRIVGITIISFFAMMFTPTKWTHHFGVFAGLAGSLGALAAVAVTSVAMRSRRNRTVFAALVLFLMAMSFASVNGWWYVSNFGVPWFNSFPQWHYGFSTMLLALTVLVLLLAAWFHFVATYNGPPKTRRGARIAGIVQSPLAIAAWALVIFEVVSLTLAMTGQYPAWSVGRSNLQALAGKTCGLADDVLVEQDPNAGMLPPIDAPVADALGAGLSEAFTPNGIPADVSADPVMERPGDRSFVSDDGLVTGSEPGTEGGTTAGPGINGSRARLPYNLDAARTPVLGSWRSGIQVPARLRSAWYRLPPRDQRGKGRCWWYPPPAGSTPAKSRCSGPLMKKRPADTPAARWASPTSARCLPGATCGRRCRRYRERHPDSSGRRRQRPGAAALDRTDTAAASAAAHAAGGGGIEGSGVPGLACGPGVSVPATVRPSERRRRNAEMAHPAGPVRRRGQLAGDGQQRRRPAGCHRVAAARDHGGQLPEGRLVAGLGGFAAVEPLLPRRHARTAEAGDRDARRSVEPGAVAPPGLAS